MLMGVFFYNNKIKSMLKITDKIVNQRKNEQQSYYKAYIINVIKKISKRKTSQVKFLN